MCNRDYAAADLRLKSAAEAAESTPESTEVNEDE